MRRHLAARLGRLTVCGVLGLSVLTTACSDGDADAASSSTQTEAPTGWCELARRVNNAIPTKRLEASRAAAEMAPEEFKDDYDQLHEYMEFERENPTDAVGIAEHGQSATPAVARIIKALRDECGLHTGIAL